MAITLPDYMSLSLDRLSERSKNGQPVFIGLVEMPDIDDYSEMITDLEDEDQMEAAVLQHIDDCEDRKIAAVQFVENELQSAGYTGHVATRFNDDLDVQLYYVKL